jgi:pimeloyl-ACP methyl ester carboxylesterase
MDTAKPLLQKHIGTFHYGQKAIPFYFWSHTPAEGDIIDTIIFLGSGQSGRIARWVAENAPAGTAVIEGLPHKEADRDAHDLKEFVRRYAETAFLAALKTFKISSANVIAESQAAPGAMWASLDRSDKVKSVALIAPLGLTARTLGSTPRQRFKELKKRTFFSAVQFVHSPLYDSRNFYLNALMLHVLLYDSRWGVSGRKYAIGASYDLREDCSKLARQLHKKGNRLTLILGTRDKMFPANEVMDALEEIGAKYITSVVIRGSHTSLAIRDGKRILNQTVQAVR